MALTIKKRLRKRSLYLFKQPLDVISGLLFRTVTGNSLNIMARALVSTGCSCLDRCIDEQPAVWTVSLSY